MGVEGRTILPFTRIKGWLKEHAAAKYSEDSRTWTGRHFCGECEGDGGTVFRSVKASGSYQSFMLLVLGFYVIAGRNRPRKGLLIGARKELPHGPVPRFEYPFEQCAVSPRFGPYSWRDGTLQLVCLQVS